MNISNGGISHHSENSVFITMLLGLPRYAKRAILMMLDFALLSLALWSSYSLRLGIFYWPEGLSLWLLLFSAPVIGVFFFHYIGLYKQVTRFYGNQAALKVMMSIGLSVLVWCLFIYMTKFTLSDVPRSVIVMYGLFSVLFILGARSFLSHFLRNLLSFGPKTMKENAIPVIIYGVGEVSGQLAQELAHSSVYQLVGFVDDNPSLWRQILFGVRVHDPQRISQLVEQSGAKEVFIADQDLPRRRKRHLLNLLAPYDVQLKALSPLHKLASDKVLVSDLQQIGLNDLLGRAPVPPDQSLLEKTVSGKSVMVTGAGGSIGSELARQIVSLSPCRLVLFERSEVALYQIEHDLRKLIDEMVTTGQIDRDRPFELVCVLGCVQDRDLLSKTIARHKINTVYHAAAYKHVPIVEENPFVGLKNNVFGTLHAAQAAMENDVDLFVLISTDKAVRPTNVMGASKRIAELCLQALAAEKNAKTVFTMVRFGNVLGSSGSVVGRFQEQIENGGPVTVTHPDIVRYFMMISEAAQLVIQAGGLAKGGDVFVLDMGRPVKIVDLAKSMINLSGLEVADENNPDGDIAIEYIGLRDGEKLYEELLINENSSDTSHESIIRNHESFLPLHELNNHLAALKLSIDDFKIEPVRDLLFDLVEGYHHEEIDQPPLKPSTNERSEQSNDEPQKEDTFSIPPLSA